MDGTNHVINLCGGYLPQSAQNKQTATRAVYILTGTFLNLNRWNLQHR